MKGLLDNELAPVTWEFGLIETSARKIAGAFVEHRTAVLDNANFELDEVRGDLRALLCRLPPLTDGEPNRFLFVPTRAEWTAFFSNERYGTDAAVLALFARELGCRAVRASFVPDDPSVPAVQRGAVMLEVFGPRSTDFLNYERSIVLANDGGKWVFEQSGDAYPFEDVDAYGAQRLRDRFTPELLDAYLRELGGIHLFDEGFYAPDRKAMLAENRGPRDRAWSDYDVPGCRKVEV